MSADGHLYKGMYGGVFTIALSTLMYEILLTRIFSVTMWYHFAFVAISVAMFGMTVGALLVYLFPKYFRDDRVTLQLVQSAFLFSLSIVLSFLTHISIPFVQDNSLGALYSMALNYTVIALPFVFSGICVCLALTKFPQHVSKLYAADLAGAALGCIALIFLLRVTDGPTAIFGVATLAGISALFFATGAEIGKGFKRGIVLCIILFATFTLYHTLLVNLQVPWLRLLWVKGKFEERALYERWNSFSRLAVWGNPARKSKPFGWGFSPRYLQELEPIEQLQLDMDASAGTILTKFDGNFEDIKYLQYDIVNLAHYLRQDSDVLVVGSGGGRDILSALGFQQKSVTGVEINGDIIQIANEEFGDFTGHLNDYPQVTFVNDEARSYIARQDKGQFDILQVSLIDTWAATAAGAFVLTENSLYTVDAWSMFLEKLSSRGILTFSRWYFKERPGEVYRLTSLAVAALKELGIEKPREHIIIVKCMTWGGSDTPDGVGTMLVSKEPFSARDVELVGKIAEDMQFDLVLTPRYAIDDTFETLASAKDLTQFIAEFPLNITPPTDENPFFFHMLRLRDMFDQTLADSGNTSFNMKAMYTLGRLLLVVIGLTFLCIVVPLLMRGKTGSLRGSHPFFLYFAGIGLGFMLVEISLMQRLIVFLGHPSYSLSVVLFSLLISSGVGSFSTQKIAESKGGATKAVATLLVLLLMSGMVTPYIMKTFQGVTTPLRILIAVAIIFPLGFFMGMPFPFGMKKAASRSSSLAPWLWGINGATSVCASVLAIAIAISSSISIAFWTGLCCYVLAFLAFLRMPASGKD